MTILQNHVDQYLEIRKPDLTQRSLESIRSVLHRFAAHCERWPVTGGDVLEFLNEGDRAEATRRGYFQYIRIFFNHLTRQGELRPGQNPAQEIVSKGLLPWKAKRKPQQPAVPLARIDTELGRHAQDFINAKARRWKPRTAESYQAILSRFASFTGDKWPITRQDIMAWLNSTEGNDTTIRTYFAFLRTFFNYLQKTRVITKDDNPARQIQQLDLLPPAPDPEPVHLPFDDIDALFEYLNEAAAADDRSERQAAIRDRAIIRFAAVTGCRSGEIAALTRDRLNLNDLAAWIPGKGTKTRHGRMVYFSEQVRDDLLPWLELITDGGELVFRRFRNMTPTINQGGEVREGLIVSGEGLTQSGMLQMFKRRQSAAKLPRLKFHALRHTSGVWALENGVSIQKVQAQLGHSRIETTMIYLLGRDPDRARAYRSVQVGG